MFITTTAVGFYSVFNDSTFISLIPTLILIEYEEIADIRRRWNAIIFNNSIEIVLKDGQSYFFTSYVNRERAFALLMMLTNNEFGECDNSQLTARAHQLRAQLDEKRDARDPDARTPSSKRSVKNEAIPMPKSVFGAFNYAGNAGQPAKLDVCIPMGIYSTSLTEVFNTIIADPKYDQVNHAINSDRNLSKTQWSDGSSDDDQAISRRPTLEEGSKRGGCYLRRTQEWEQPMNTSGAAAFLKMPEYTNVFESVKVYVNSTGTQFIRESMVDTTGVMYSDHIRLRNRLIVTELSSTETQVDSDLSIIWLKSTLMKAILKSAIEKEWIQSQSKVRQAITQTCCGCIEDSAVGAGCSQSSSSTVSSSVRQRNIESWNAMAAAPGARSPMGAGDKRRLYPKTAALDINEGRCTPQSPSSRLCKFCLE